MNPENINIASHHATLLLFANFLEELRCLRRKVDSKRVKIYVFVYFESEAKVRRE